MRDTEESPGAGAWCLVINALTIDVEEYFHPSEVQLTVDASRWDSLPSRAEYQTGRVLDLLDRHGVSATFFVLGWLAERKPQLVREIAGRGHEIGCHSYAHQLVYELTPEQFMVDTRRAIAAIQSACGRRPVAYRAPSYSITRDCLWALDALVQMGFRFDSSIYPIHHDRYGIPGFDRFAAVANTASGSITEIPIGTVKLGRNTIAPIGGGGYLRLLPYRYTAAGIRRVNTTESSPVCVYFHPWEIDPEQPRLASGLISRLRTYSGLKSMELKLDRLLRMFEFSTISAVYGGTAASGPLVMAARAAR